MSDLIELSIPVKADLVVLARLTAATVAARAGFDVEEIEDLRLAVDELCLSMVGPTVEGRYHLTYVGGDGEVEVTCVFEPGEGGGAGRPLSDPDDLSIRILEALVDEHGRDGSDRPRAWLRKRRSTLGR